MPRWSLIEGVAPHPRAASWALALFAAAGGVLFMTLRRPAGRDGQPFVPVADDAVVETLPRAAGDPRSREEKRLRQLLSAVPRDVTAATRLARLEIEDARATSDPRRLGYAQAALAPWWSAAEAPPEVLLLRATIRQSRHDFPGALVDLDSAAAAAPGNPQIWLTRAVVLSVLARYEEAAASCAPLASRLVQTVCRAGVLGVTGQATQAAAALSHALAQVPPSAPERPWALSVLAEITGWTGDRAEAERLARDALAVDPDDAYTRAQLADLLLEAGRASEVLELLHGREQNDGLLLRQALAATQARAAAASELVREVSERFAAARLRGDQLHGREEARFELVIRHDAPRALSLARANWEVQHEPADALILLQAALAANDRAAAAPALEWANRTAFQGSAVIAAARRVAAL